MVKENCKKAMKKLIALVVCIGLQSCFFEPSITITKDYIVNNYWDQYNHILLIEKMKIKENKRLDVFDPNFKRNTPNHWNIANKLEVDSTFIYRNSTSGKTTKIYFNKKNENDWSFGHFTIEKEVSEIGSLKNDTWYKFSNLRTLAYYVYIYVDPLGEVHRFNVNLSNF